MLGGAHISVVGLAAGFSVTGFLLALSAAAAAKRFKFRARYAFSVVLFVFYICVLLPYLFAPIYYPDGSLAAVEGAKTLDLIPFFVSGKVIWSDIISNIVIFLPFGFLLYMLAPLRRKEIGVLIASAAGALFSALIEIAQLGVFFRVTDINDVIFDFTGAFIGALIAFLTECVYIAALKKRRPGFFMQYMRNIEKTDNPSISNADAD